MALVSGVGAGSGLDISSLVTQLVQAEAATRNAPLNRREARAKAQISAFAKVSSGFSSLQSALGAFKGSGMFGARSFTSSGSGFATARASGGGTPATTGSFEVVVDQLAAAQRLRFNELASSASLDPGTLTLSFGSGPEDSFEVSLAGGETVRQLAAAINTQANGRGISASVISSETGESLVLTGVKTGEDHAFSVTQTSGSGNLSLFETGTPANFTELAAAQDARAYLDGVLVTSASNTLNDAIEGVQIELLKLTDGIAENPANVRITVTEDRSPLRSALAGLVKGYNAAMDAVRETSAVNLESKTASTLTGDALVRGAANQIRSALGNLISEAGKSGIDLGLSSDLQGKISFDQAKLNAALVSNPQAVSALLEGDDSVLQRGLGSTVERLLSPNEGFAQRTDSLKRQVDTVGTQRETVQRQLDMIEARYRRQFTALDALIGQLNATSSFLGQQLASLPGMAPSSRSG